MQTIHRREFFKAAGATSIVALGGVIIPTKLFAECTTQVQDTQFSEGLIDFCTGEQASINHSQHLVITTCLNKDGTTTYRLHFEIHGTGLGLTSGTQYVIEDKIFQRTINPPGCPYSYSFKETVIAISQGSAPNEQIVMTYNVSFDANCQATVSGPTLDTDCHG